MLSHEAICTLAQLYGAIEFIVFWLEQVSQLTVVLLEKPTGGCRPIGLFSALYRVWVKARGDLCMQWGVSHDLPCFAMGKQRSPVDCVWRQAVRAEASLAKQRTAATLLWDLVKLYETMRHGRLVSQAVRLDFPLRILELNLQGYSHPRFVSMTDMVADPCFPSQGVVAGCGAATTHVKRYCYEPFRLFGARWPQVGLDAYIDDMQVSTEGDKDAVVCNMVDASGDLAVVFTDELGSQISLPKRPLSRPLTGSLLGSGRPFGKFLGRRSMSLGTLVSIAVLVGLGLFVLSLRLV